MAFEANHDSEPSMIRRLCPGVWKEENGVLTTWAKRFGMSWERLHTYKTFMMYPVLPDNMDSTICSKGCGTTCEYEFSSLDRCIEQGKLNEEQHSPFARMAVCKQHWHLFEKCIRKRDQKFISKVFRWERNHIRDMDPQEKLGYVEDLDNKLEYTEWCLANEIDKGEYAKLERDLLHLRLRKENLETSLTLGRVNKVWRRSQDYVKSDGRQA